MPSYKVSYKILRQQGEDMKAVAKLVDVAFLDLDFLDTNFV